VRAAEAWPDVIRKTKTEIESVAAEVSAADPYPGSNRWLPRLKSIVERLAGAADSNREQRTANWFEQALAGFGDKNQAESIRALEAMRQRLDLLDDNRPAEDGNVPDERRQRPKASIKSLVRHRNGEDSDTPPEKKKSPERDEAPRREVNRDVRAPADQQPSAPSATVELPSGLGTYGGLFLLGLLLAVAGVVAVRFWASLPEKAAKPKAKQAELPAEVSSPRPDEQLAPVLWRQAEDLARAGQHREAVRALYLAVLSLLHSQRLLRYEPTRTNGEYVRQVRLAPQAPAGLVDPFESLTRRFESLWYGGGGATPIDFQSCLSTAEQVRALAQA
jgi:hypothetical protein